MVEDDFAGLFVRADADAARWQRRFLRSERVQLVALIAAAVLANLGDAGLVGSTVAVVVALGAHVDRLVTRADERWWEGRALAESAKTLCWCFVVGGDPFRVGAPQAEVALSERLRELADELSGGAPVAVTAAPVTDGMRATRGLPEPERVTLYQRERIQGQMTWYGAKAGFNDRRRNLWAGVTIAFQVLALALGIVAVATDLDVDVVGVLTSCASAAVAWSAVKQHEVLARSYAVASNELAVIDTRITNGAWTDWGRFVNEAEEAISREHTSWRARRAV